MTADPHTGSGDGSGDDPGDGSADDAGDDGDYPPPCIDPETVSDLVARDRRPSGTALRADASGREYSYRDFVTTTYKAGNVLRHLGVRRGEEVLVVPTARPEPVLAFYGAAQLGAVIRFSERSEATEPRVVVAPAERGFELPPGHHRLVYGETPTDPATTHWETEVWSENPAVHPTAVDPNDPLLVDDGDTYSQMDALSAASRTVSELDLAPGSTVAVDGSLTAPETVVAGLLAPIAAGGTVVFPDSKATDGASPDVSLSEIGFDDSRFPVDESDIKS